MIDVENRNIERNHWVQDGFGKCYHRLGQYDEALHYFDTAIENEPKNPVFLMNRA